MKNALAKPLVQSRAVGLTLLLLLGYVANSLQHVTVLVAW